MNERNRAAYEKLTPEQKAKVDASRARRATPEARAAEALVREQVRAEIPPLVADQSLVSAMAGLRLAREQLGLSLADVSERTGLDRATISRLETGKVPNPTYSTVKSLARAVGKRIAWEILDLDEAGETSTLDPHGRPLKKILDSFQTNNPSPDDEAVRRWIDEQRMEKNG
jgi:transcriptional regulator with XRE-family HTH domain